MWRLVIIVLGFFACLFAMKTHSQLQRERGEWSRERIQLRAELAELQQKVGQGGAPGANAAGVDAELDRAAKKIFGDLIAPQPAAPVERRPSPMDEVIPFVKEPELRASADVSWQVTQRNSSWHRLSYAISLKSAVDRTLTVDLNVKAVNVNGLPIHDKNHWDITLPADGRAVVIRDYMLVSCPTCLDIFNVGGDINIKAAR